MKFLFRESIFKSAQQVLTSHAIQNGARRKLFEDAATHIFEVEQIATSNLLNPFEQFTDLVGGALNGMCTLIVSCPGIIRRRSGGGASNPLAQRY